jgi:hypothetical protein
MCVVFSNFKALIINFAEIGRWPEALEGVYEVNLILFRGVIFALLILNYNSSNFL